MADTRDLKSLGCITRAGSSPASGTNQEFSKNFLMVICDIADESRVPHGYFCF